MRPLAERHRTPLPSGIVLSIGRIGAGAGYQYLVHQVATQDSPAPGQRLLSYYEESGYPPGCWWGTGAEALGLSGRVNESDMQALFGEGCHPRTRAQLGRAFPAYRSKAERIRVRLAALGHPPTDQERVTIEAEETAKGTPQAVAGFDFTFSAPKSVSILWALGSDEIRDQVAAAHELAWRTAMADVEAEVAATRLGRNGLAQVDVNGLSAAAFLHFYSRSGDPQLHTHVATSALVETPDARWRRVDSRALYRAAAMVGERYTGYLTGELSVRLGLSWRYREGRHPGVRLPEVKGIDDELIRAFSSRRADIDAALAQRVARYRADRGRSPDRRTLAALCQEVVLAGRPDPAQRRFVDQQAAWRHLAEEVTGVAPEDQPTAFAALCRAPEHCLDAGPNELEGLVPEVLARLLETQGTWTTRDIQRHGTACLREAGHAVDRKAVARLVDTFCADEAVYCVEAPELVPAPSMLRRADGTSVFERAGEQRWTHRAVLDAEETLRSAVEEPGPSVAVSTAEFSELGSDQAEAVARLASSGRLVDALIGPAGTGKTKTLAALVQTWAKGEGRAFVLAPTAVAAAELGTQLGVPGETLDRALGLWRDGRELPQRGDLVLIDEASMATSLKLVEVVSVARKADAALRLAGDPCQLVAVGPGGGLEIVADAIGGPQLSELRRFNEAWEAKATLGLRRGDPSVLERYQAHRRIRAGAGPDVADQLYGAWREATRAGQAAIMIAADRATVAALSARARAERVEAGEVEATGVVLYDDAVAGVGDVIVARRNDRRLGLHAHGGTAGFVRNHDRFVITRREPDGSLVVSHLATGAHARLPADYAKSHAELSYAHTIHGAQGLTVDVGLTLVRSTDERRDLYVAMTRGRTTNVAFVVTEDLEDEPHGYHATRNARAVLAQVLANHEPLAATTQLERSYEAAERLDTLADRYEHARRAELEARLARVAKQIGAENLVGTPSWSDVLAAADGAEARGVDTGAVLIPTALRSAEDMRAALSRARPPDRDRGFRPLAIGLVPMAGPGVSPEVSEYLRGLTEVMQARVRSIEAQVLTDPPAWARPLGPPPDDPCVRMEWSGLVGKVAAWRERERITGLRPLGPPVESSDRARLVAAEAAHRAVELARAESDGTDLRTSLTARQHQRIRTGR